MKPRFGLLALITFLAAFSSPLSPNLTVPFSMSQVLAQIPVNRQAEAKRLAQQGLKQHDTKQFKAALQSFQQALAIYQELQDRRQGEGTVLFGMGLAYYSLGDYTKATESYQQSLAIVRIVGNRLMERDILSQLGRVYYSLGEQAKAIDSYQQALVIANGT